MTSFAFRLPWRRGGRDVPTPGRAAPLDDLLADLVRQPDLASLRRTLTDRLADLSGCERVVFCEPVPGGLTFAAGASATGRPAFASRGPLARWLRVNEMPLLLPDDREVFEYLPAEEQAELEQAETRVCLPSMVRGTLAAIVVLGRPDGRPAPTDEDLDRLQRYVDQAALVAERVAEAEAAREREQARLRAQQLAATGKLAAAMAHEIRNPLTAIRSGVQHIASSRQVADDDQALLTEVVADLDRINRAISNVLGYSRPRDLELETIDLVPVVEHALTLLGPHLRHHGIAVARQVPDGPVPVRADPHELQQVLVNVLLNAVEASPDGGRVEIVVERTAPDGVRVVIADTGKGMDEAALARAFEPFFTTKKQGTGLGLAVCRETMRRHGGEIVLARREPQGTVATLVLPGAPA